MNSVEEGGQARNDEGASVRDRSVRKDAHSLRTNFASNPLSIVRGVLDGTPGAVRFDCAVTVTHVHVAVAGLGD